MNNTKNDKDTIVFDLKNFKEVIDLIPSIQEAVLLGLKRELKIPKQLEKIVKMDRSFIRGVSTLIQGKWTVDIIYMIFYLNKPFFNELRRALPEINTRTLTSRLSSLEETGMIKRTVQTERPIRVTYEMTSFGKGLALLFSPLVIYVALEYFRKKKITK